jgi:hypothetical protein
MTQSVYGTMADDGLIDAKSDSNECCYDTSAIENDESVSMYDWIADSATTSHITNMQDAFIKYTPAADIPVTGVGNV